MKRLLLLLGYNVDESMQTIYKVEKLTKMCESCKNATAVLASADSQVLQLTSFFSSLAQLANKNSSRENYRQKRDVDFLIDFLIDPSTINTVKCIDELLKLADPCLSWTRRYVKFWICDIFQPILDDHLKRFSVDFTGKLVVTIE